MKYWLALAMILSIAAGCGKSDGIVRIPNVPGGTAEVDDEEDIRSDFDPLDPSHIGKDFDDCIRRGKRKFIVVVIHFPKQWWGGDVWYLKKIRIHKFLDWLFKYKGLLLRMITYAKAEIYFLNYIPHGNFIILEGPDLPWNP